MSNAEKTEKLDNAMQGGIIDCMSMSKRTRRPNHFGCLISKGEGKPYLAKWTVNGKTFYRSTGESNYNKALRVLDEFTRSLREDNVEDKIAALEAQLAILRGKVRKDEIPLAQLWDEYEKTLWQESITDGTKAGYKRSVSHMAAWMTRHGCRNVSDVNRVKAEIYLQEIQAKLGIVTYNCRLVLFKKVWSVFAKMGKSVDASTWADFQKLRGAKNSSQRRALTNEEVKRLLENADADTALLIKISAYTGMRLGDACLLTWGKMDFDKRLISYTPEKTKRHGKVVVVPMHAELVEALQEAKKTATGDYVNQRNAREYISGHIRERINALFVKCGIVTSEKGADGKLHVLTGFHALRHFFVSNAVNSGMSELAVQKIVGHSTLGMTEHYYHEDEDKLREGLENMRVA